MTSPILNIAAYKFVSLEGLPERREVFRKMCRQHELRGTVMLSPEGINCFLAGDPDQLRRWVEWLRGMEEFADIEIKESYSDHQPFNRMLVKLKKEIIAFGVEDIDPRRRTSPKLSPAELKQWLDEGRDVTLLDVRNDYEIKLGTFESAQPIGVDHFRDFPAAVDALPEDLKEKPMVMFCTGGIRCEKAGPLMQGKGFQNVFQLDGGILKYFETCGEAHYDGDCFVFDDRVALDPQLQPTKAAQCYACQAVLTSEEQQCPEYVVGQSCPYCYATPEQQMRRRIEKRHAMLQQITQPLPGSVPYVNRRPINVPARFDGRSLLDCLAEMHPHVSREHWQASFAAGRIVQAVGRGGEQRVAAPRIVRGGEQFLHVIPDTVEPDVDASIEILFEDEAIVAVNKPAPLPMHPCGRFNRNTLVSILNSLYAPQVLRPAHRLDANTTGIVVLSRTQAFARQLQPQFQTTVVEKVYLVRCQGHPAEDRFVCDAPIGRDVTLAGGRVVDPQGLSARTEFCLRQRLDDGTALLEARPITGRTNQIRVHLWHLGLPVLGDPVYLANQQLGDTQTLTVCQTPMALHAWKLSFVSPLTGETLQLQTPPPSSMGPRPV
ncbi:sulfurtransferase [Roseimaritima ulvae]|uniref:tRNA uridine(34) hydroxylase n=1 Tax=Roseimaritima ulvae TaxID=980254 RepID=A0A5B9QZY2_9BACT|nr:sulfurtransferase [Roseimaritima ulvae]QEG43500.1 Ribosomal large subunit pseudouridine synthase A [Roseimaritima ulvae]